MHVVRLQLAPGGAAPPALSTVAFIRMPMNATETNLLDAHPLVALPAPKPTHSMYMEVVVQEDATGVNRAYFNGISDQASMSATTPL
jgi:hypothetical protein